MPLYKREDSSFYWYLFYLDGQRIRGSTFTTDEDKANEYEAKFRAKLYDTRRLGAKVDYSWRDAVVKYRKELNRSDKTESTKSQEVGFLNWLDKILGKKMLKDISLDDIENIIDTKQEDDVSNRTINSYIKQVRQVLYKARDKWEWIDRTPKITLLPTPKGRVRFLTHDQADLLCDSLPTHLSRMARFTLETGLRRTNVTQLRWTEVDLAGRRAWVHAPDTKNEEPLPVPLNEKALAVLRECKDDDDEFVFVYNGAPVHQTSTATWYATLKLCKIQNFRWHDLRHTWASWLRQEGCELDVLQRMGGWKSLAMVQRYAHLRDDHLDNYVKKLDEAKRLKTLTATKTATVENHESENVA